jgi:hypothetical protein
MNDARVQGLYRWERPFLAGMAGHVRRRDTGGVELHETVEAVMRPDADGKRQRGDGHPVACTRGGGKGGRDAM